MVLPTHTHGKARKGSVVTLFAVMLPVLLALIAFAVDIGYLVYIRTRLQVAADAASLAGAAVMHDSRGKGKKEAVEFAELNTPGWGKTLKRKDVTYGTWDTDRRQFTPTNTDPDAIRVIVRRSESNGNPVQLFFASILGFDKTATSAEAVAYAPPPDSPGFRFLLDDEMIDSDVQAIEDLAQANGVSSEEIISDNDNDGFIDLPPGTELELPTGQQGDEGVFDRTTFEGAFPFGADTPYTMVDFLAEGTALQQELGTQSLQDVEWSASDAPHPELIGKKVLDPVPGCDPVDSHSDILSLPDANTSYVSPVYKSDVSMAETDPEKYGSPAANLQGERRGLLAFKIISARSSPEGGSYLPLITIEVLDPSDINLNEVAESGSGVGGSIRLVK